MATLEAVIVLNTAAIAKKAADLEAARQADAQAGLSTTRQAAYDKAINDALLASGAPNNEVYDPTSGMLYRGQAGANAPLVTKPPVSSVVTVDDSVLPTDGTAPGPVPDPAPTTGLSGTMGGATVVNSPG